MSLNRELLQIVEIDVEQCSHTYGTGGCSAVLGGTGVKKCYNFLNGCQVPDDFATSTKTLRYSQNQGGLPKGTLIYPAMTAPVSTNAAKISVGGVSDKFAPIGKHATVTVKLQDFADSDIGLDPYQAERKTGAAMSSGIGFDPATQGTHFGRLRQRFPYYTDRALRVKEGYVGQDLDDMVTKYYNISGWSGPDANGAVTITATSILDFGNALAPKASGGRLSQDIGESLAGFTLSPSGIESEYKTAGYAAIGSEIVQFLRVGNVVTLLARGLFGTEVSSHDADDVFQQCLSYGEDTLPDIAYDLCKNFADVPDTLLDKTGWDAEADTWLPSLRLTTVIPKPTPVTKLMSELCLHGVTFYEDDTTQELRMSPDRPANAGAALEEIIENRDIIENTIKVTDLPDSQVTRAAFWFGVNDYTDSTTNGSNYKNVAVSFDSEKEERYKHTKEFEVFSRWLTSYSASVELGSRMVSRFGDIPKQITFEVDVKDRAKVAMGKAVLVTSRVLQDDDGASVPTGMQITSVEEIVAGHRLRVTGQSFDASKVYAIYMANDAPDFGDATDDDKRFGAWYADDDGLAGDGTAGNTYF